MFLSILRWSMFILSIYNYIYLDLLQECFTRAIKIEFKSNLNTRITFVYNFLFCIYHCKYVIVNKILEAHNTLFIHRSNSVESRERKTFDSCDINYCIIISNFEVHTSVIIYIMFHYWSIIELPFFFCLIWLQFRKVTFDRFRRNRKCRSNIPTTNLTL